MEAKGPSLMFRCVLALLLMVGFYLFAVGIATGLLYIPYAMWKYAERLQIHLAFVCVTSGAIILWSVLPRFEHFTPPGPELKPAEHPELFKELKATAEAMGEAMPVEVYALPEVNAWVCNRGGIMGFGSRRVMGLGLPLLKVLNVSELRAVLAHEFGHYHGGETALAPWVYKTREAISRTLDGLPGGIIHSLFLLYGKLFLRLTHAVSRQQEYAADALAAQLASPEALINGLQKIHRVGMAFDVYWSSEVAPVVSSGFRPPIEEGFTCFMDAAYVKERTSALLKEELETGKQDPYDTHPNMKDRLAALQAYSGVKAALDEAPALALVTQVQELETNMLLALLPPDKPLVPITWAEAMERVYLPAWIEQASHYAAALAGIRSSQLPELAKTPQKLVDAFAPHFPLGTEEESKVELIANSLGSTLTILLHRKGFPVTCVMGEPISVRIGEDFLLPFSLMDDLHQEKLTTDQWLKQCQVAGITELDLGEQAKQWAGEGRKNG